MCCLRVSFVYVEKKTMREREASKGEEQEYRALNNCLNEYSNNRNQFQRSVMISHIYAERKRNDLFLFILKIFVFLILSMFFSYIDVG